MYYKDNNNRFFQCLFSYCSGTKYVLKKAFIDLCRTRFIKDKLLR